MISSFLITFRETLEAALVIGIVLAYLAKTKETKHNKTVYSAIACAVIASVIGAFLFNTLAGGFEGRSEQIFEGTSMLFASFLITFTIFWMLKQKHIVVHLHTKIEHALKQQQKIWLFFLVFMSVFREGIETVIFLGAASFATSKGDTMIGAASGIIVAIILGYFVFNASKKINIKQFFNITSVMLILFSAGMVSQAFHEFEEAKLIKTYIEHVWDINPEQNPDGTYPLLHHKGYIGALFKELFGYSGNPSLWQVSSYVLYIILIIFLWRKIESVHARTN